MKHVAFRVRELVSSNLDAMISKATDPAKALGLLRSEVEETIISLHRELTMTKRQQERTQDHAKKLAGEAETWTGKAKIAVEHGREDLARAALQAREAGMADAAAVREEASQLANEIAELEAAIGDLETKRADITNQTAQLGGAATPADPPLEKGSSSTARRLDRIDELERRLNFQTHASAQTSAASQATADAEIAALSQSSMIDAELTAMKEALKKSAKRKVK